MRVILQVCRDEQVEFPPDLAQQVEEEFFATNGQPGWSAQLGFLLMRLWQLPDVKLVYEERDRLFQLNDGIGFLFDQLPRLCSSTYVPTSQDVLRVRIRTADYETCTYSHKNYFITIWDLGGQRSERRKWIPCVQGASAVLFVVSLSEYDQVLREDPNRPRLMETMLVFEEISAFLKGRIPILLAFNKVDLFQEKLKKRGINYFYKTYAGPAEWGPSAHFIREQFLARAAPSSRIHSFFVSAIRLDSVASLWNDMRDLVCKNANLSL